jgi:D-glycero-D-manno-heptose 1,7-bisphosphate phosphatase
MIEQAVVLVGGLGTRLGPLTASTPKPMLDVGGRPFLRWLVDALRRQGVRQVLLLAGFAAEALAEAFGGDADVQISIEPEPLGTGGALAFAAPRLQDAFLLLNGDSLFDIDGRELAASLGDGDAVLALRQVPNAARYGVASLEGDRVTAFQSNGLSAPGLINGGVAYLRRDVVARVPPGRAVSIESEIYPALAAEGLLRGKVFAAPFIDIGTPEDFARAQTYVPKVLLGR